MKSRDYFTQLLAAYWFAPPVALWRAVELRTAAAETYAHPILDLGCGDGLIAHGMFEPEHPIEVGMDPWLDQLRKASASGMYRHVDLAAGHRLPYADSIFATVFSNSVLEHIPDIGPVLSEVSRVLAPGGHFIFTVPSDAFRSMLNGYVERAERGDVLAARVYAGAIDTELEHYHYHSTEEWESMLAAVGVHLVKSRYYMPEPAMRFWDRMNPRYGIGNPHALWRYLVSPRLRKLGYQSLIKACVTRSLARRWRKVYEMEVAEGTQGGGLLIVARKAG